MGLRIAVSHLSGRHGVGDILFEGADGPRIARRIADQVAAQCQRRQRTRFLHAAFSAAQGGLAQLLEFALHKGRLPHDFRGQMQRRDEA